MSTPVTGERAPLTFEDLLCHVIAQRGYPDVSIEVPPEAPPTDEDVAIAARVLRAWERASETQRSVRAPTNDVWQMVQHEFHGDFLATMESRDPAKVAAILVRFFRHDISYGMGGGQGVVDSVSNPDGSRRVATQAVDRVAALAVALGVLPYENPEQGRWGQNLYVDPAELADRIEAKLGIRLCPPSIGGYLGLRIRDGLIFPTACYHVYAAWRLSQMIAETRRRRICEIGGGYGGCARYSWLLGLRDYRIFDLPSINVLQGYYLIRSLPDAKIVLYGERESGDAVCVYPYWMLRKQPSRSFGVAVNQNSLPEIMQEMAQQYLHDIARTAGFFLSINQESQGPSGPPGVFQNSVPEMAARVPGLRRISRHPFWLRHGYAEEVYRCVGGHFVKRLFQRT